MRWDSNKAKEEVKGARLSRWHRVFCWLPVEADEGVICWLEFVERRWTGSWGGEGHYRLFEYRCIDKLVKGPSVLRSVCRSVGYVVHALAWLSAALVVFILCVGAFSVIARTLGLP